MTKGDPSSKGPDKPTSGARQERLSKALRDNLRKRKAQARARTEGRRESGPGKRES